jgi:hypothetical protein
MVGVFDADGVAMAQWSARAEELKQPITLAALPVAPGRYRVRIAAAAADGHVGTVDQAVRSCPRGCRRTGRRGWIPSSRSGRISVPSRVTAQALHQATLDRLPGKYELG